MRRLLTPDGLRVLVARKLDSLRGGRRDQCANGDLSNLSGIGRFQAFIDRRDGFDDDIAVKVYLDCQQGHDFTYLRVVIDSAKYEFSVNYIPRRNEHEDRQGEEHDEDEISNFLENHGMTWRLCEDFDKASPGDRRFQSFLAGMHFLQLVKRCIGCNTPMSTPHSLCVQCDCETGSVHARYPLRVPKEHTKAGCDFEFHALNLDKFGRCFVCKQESAQQKPCGYDLHAWCLDTLGFCPTCGRRQERKQPIPFCTPELHAMLVKQTGRCFGCTLAVLE